MRLPRDLLAHVAVHLGIEREELARRLFER